jgi:lipopolysaccharide export LptBFGC system permease protein LptF
LPIVARGANELTFSELGARLTALQQRGASTERTAFALSYHMRLAASFAPIVMTLVALALSIARRTTAASIGIVVIAAVVYFGYGALVIAGQPPRSYPWLPLAAVVWFPNVLFTLLAAVLFVRSHAPKICS